MPEAEEAKVIGDRTGFCLLYKRLERGVFRIPDPLGPDDAGVCIDARELTRILAGVALPPSRLRENPCQRIIYAAP